VLAVPPAIAARMAVTIDSIAPGRFGVNIVTGWQEAEYAQMGLWPGERHYAHRYDFATEYVQILRELWATGRSNFAGEYFRYDDCQLLPRPSEVTVVCAGQSDRGVRFCAEQGDYNFVVSNGVNTPTAHAGTLARIQTAAEQAGRDVGAYVLVMVIADETDEAAFAKWRRYHDGIHTEALAWALGQTAPDPSSRTESSSLHVMAKSVEEGMVNLGMGTVIGSFENVARMLDEMASLPGTSGVMLVMDDYLQGVEDFGTRIQPLMRSRMQHATGAATHRATSPAGPRTGRPV
jgi:pyrimidine oxygenase